jgi:alanyl-tRNA synthetase
MDGVTPGRTEQGYVLRRLIRRAVRHGRMLGIEDSFTQKIADIAIDQFAPIYPLLAEKKPDIIGTISEEEDRFRKTIKSGLKKFEQLLSEKGDLSGEDAFYLYETFGFPVEITKEMLEEKGKSFDIKEYERAYEAHRDKSRTAAAGFFKGGLSDTSDISKKYHTATHLLHAALREVLGDHVYQQGSNINPERLRFDFPNDRKLTPEELEKVERIVNEKISEGLDIQHTEMPKDEALKIVSHAAFTEKYGETVKVFTIGNEPNVFSREICGGPHVQNTSELGTFKIIKQENVGAGIKRIKAVLT